MGKNTLMKKSGNEVFCGMDKTLTDFWAWAHSDLLSNAERGRFAEYLVNCALQTDSLYRVEWDAIDAVSPEGIRVEVKSSAYLQSWKQSKLSEIQFDIAPKYAWDSKENVYSQERCRSADVYVFCLFACKDAVSANPMDLTQWEFYVLSTQVLDVHALKQKSIRLNPLLKLGAEQVSYDELYDAVKRAAQR